MTTSTGNRALAVALAALICLGLTSCGQKEAQPVSRPAANEEAPVVYGDSIPLERWKVFMAAVNEYEELPDLRCAVADLDALRDALVEAGVPEGNITALESGAGKGKTPDKKTIEREYGRFIKSIAPGDLALVFLSGHGIQPPGDEGAFFAPEDLRRSNVKKSGVSISWMTDELIESPAHFRWMIVDACRSGTTADEAGFASSSHIFIKTSGSISLWQSCSEGESSWESTTLGHGIFTHNIVRGLARDRNPAVGENRDQLRFSALFGFVCSETSKMARELTGGKAEQTPQFTGGTQDLTLLSDLTVDGASLVDRRRARDRFEDATRYYEMKRYDSALTEIDAALALWQGSDQKYSDLRRKIELGKQSADSDAAFQQAQLYMKDGEYEAALTEIQEALKLVPSGQEYAGRRELFEKFAAQAEKGVESIRGVEEYQKGLVCYFGTEGADMNLQEAGRLFRIAADQGNLKAKGILALMHYNGEIDGRYDREKAFQLASEEGVSDVSPYACKVLYLCYRFGIGGAEQNIELSQECCLKALNEFRALAEDGETGAEIYGAFLRYESRIDSANADARAAELALTAERLAGENCVFAMRIAGLSAEHIADIYTENFYSHHAEDGTKVISWYEQAAAKNCADAMLALGDCYSSGLGTYIHVADAGKWYENAYNSGSIKAHARIANLILEGKATGITPESALDILMECAEAGCAYAMLSLSECYFKGKGVQQDAELGLQWLHRAALVDDNPETLNSMGANMSDYFHDKAPEEVVRWLKKAASVGCRTALNNLALCSIQGYGTERDVQKALRYYEKSYRQGESHVAIDISEILLNEERYEEARKWLQRVPQIAHYNLDKGERRYLRAEADYYLAKLNRFGLGGEKNIDEAIRLYKIAANAGSKRAAYELGVLYTEGKEVPQDPEKSARWLAEALDLDYVRLQKAKSALYQTKTKASNNPELRFELLNRLVDNFNDAWAMNQIAECYRIGDGVEHDAEKWREWRQKAIDAGYNPHDDEE